MNIFTSDFHAEQWTKAIERVRAIRDDGTVISHFGASLFIITGIPFLYDRVAHHIHKDYIDIEAIFDSGLSQGETVLVALAGNLYNGGFFDDYTPADILNYCDGDMAKMAATALLLRTQKININTVFTLKIF